MTSAHVNKYGSAWHNVSFDLVESKEEEEKHVLVAPVSVVLAAFARHIPIDQRMKHVTDTFGSLLRTIETSPKVSREDKAAIATFKEMKLPTHGINLDEVNPYVVNLLKIPAMMNRIMLQFPKMYSNIDPKAAKDALGHLVVVKPKDAVPPAAQQEEKSKKRPTDAGAEQEEDSTLAAPPAAKRTKAPTAPQQHEEKSKKRVAEHTERDDGDATPLMPLEETAPAPKRTKAPIVEEEKSNKRPAPQDSTPLAPSPAPKRAKEARAQQQVESPSDAIWSQYMAPAFAAAQAAISREGKTRMAELETLSTSLDTIKEDILEKKARVGFLEEQSHKLSEANVLAQKQKDTLNGNISVLEKAHDELMEANKQAQARTDAANKEYAELMLKIKAAQEEARKFKAMLAQF